MKKYFSQDGISPSPSRKLYISRRIHHSMGSRSGTGYRDLLGLSLSSSERQLMKSHMGELDGFLRKKEGRKAVEMGLTLLSMSHPALNQFYVTYRVSRIAYETYKTYREKDLRTTIQKAGKEFAPFLIGSVVGEIVDNELSDLAREERISMSSNQLNLTKMAAKRALMFIIQKEIGG